MSDKPEIDIRYMQVKGGKDKRVSHIDTLEEVERKHIIKVLDICNGKIGGKGGAADLLGLKRTTLNSKIEKLGIKKYLWECLKSKQYSDRLDKEFWKNDTF